MITWNVKKKFIFFFLPFLAGCLFPARMPSTEQRPLCYNFTYDKSKNIWIDSAGNPQTCTIYDYKNIFPLLENNRCEKWKDYFGLPDEDESSLGPEIEFQRILIYGELVCLRQDYIETGTVNASRDQNFCVALHEGKDISLEECP